MSVIFEVNNMLQFKAEYKQVVTFDAWGNCMAAFFEVAGQMYVRNLHIPAEWQYKPGLRPTDPDCYWHEIFSNTDDELLLDIGNLLHRYSEYLRYKGCDY